MRKLFTITTTQGRLIFQGHHQTIKDCIQDAANKNINLSHGDFRHINLSNIALDGAELQHADFTGANLTGANLSEANLSHAIFDQADLYNTCFAASNLQNANFLNANFGGADITKATIDGAHFSGTSCLDLNFITSQSMQNCTYITPEMTHKKFSTPPIIIKGINDEALTIWPLATNSPDCNHHKTGKIMRM